MYTEYVDVRLSVSISMSIADVTLNNDEIGHVFSWRDVLVRLLYVSYRQFGPVFIQPIFRWQLCNNVQPQQYYSEQDMIFC